VTRSDHRSRLCHGPRNIRPIETLTSRPPASVGHFNHTLLIGCAVSLAGKPLNEWVSTKDKITTPQSIDCAYYRTSMKSTVAWQFSSPTAPHSILPRRTSPPFVTPTFDALDHTAPERTGVHEPGNRVRSSILSKPHAYIMEYLRSLIGLARRFRTVKRVTELAFGQI
jgi:hypothetical protein